MLELERIVHHLLVEQNVNMLDKTKCSTSARNIYNYLCGARSMTANNNLCDMAPNLAELVDALKVREQRAVYYVHLDHLTNETSHYFIIVQCGDFVTVLQSAVFEFSIYDWLYPEESMRESARDLAARREELSRSDDIRDGFLLRQYEMSSRRTLDTLQSISVNAFSKGVQVDTRTFEQSFLKKLAQLEGIWTDDDVSSKCATYTELFACKLDEDIIRSHIRLGIKPASVKVQMKQLDVPTKHKSL